MMKKLLISCAMLVHTVVPADAVCPASLKQAMSYLTTHKTMICEELKEDSKIFGSTLLIALALGIVNNSVAALLCPDYFSDGGWLVRTDSHGDRLRSIKENPQTSSIKERVATYVLESKNPAILGVYWGIADMGGVGIFLGVAATLAARAGKGSKLTFNEVRTTLGKPLGKGLACLGALILGAGVLGYKRWLSSEFYIALDKKCGYPSSSEFPKYAANELGLQATYYGGTALGVGLISWLLYQRSVIAQKSSTGENVSRESLYQRLYSLLAQGGKR